MTDGGFTLIELLVVITALTILSVIALTNVRGIRAENRDSDRKKDINTLHYKLEAQYEKNGFYPKNLNKSTLPGINTADLTDSSGVVIGKSNSEYLYTPRDCQRDKCKGYKLETRLEREANFVRDSLNT